MRIENNIFLRAFSDETRKRLLETAMRKTYSDGQIIFREDDSSDGVYLVISGQIELIKDSPGDRQITTLAVVPEGQCFGEMGVLDDSGRSTGARARGETTLLKLPTEPLMEIIRSEPGEVCLHIVRRISAYLRETNKRLVDEMLRKERLQLVGEMAGSIIHDFKNPMTSVQIAAELIGKKSLDDDTSECCRLIREQVARMVAMAAEILDYSQGEMKLRKEVISATAFLERTTFLNKDYLQENRVSLQCVSTDGMLEIDVNRMLRVMQNLIGNAVRAMGDAGGRIDVEASRPDEHSIELRVSDNGPGIPERIRQTLFDPFVTEGKQKGTGLGLAIVKRIVDAHGGSISYASNPGEGTTFTIRLSGD